MEDRPRRRLSLLSLLTFLSVLIRLGNSQDLSISCPQGWRNIYSTCYLAVPSTSLPFHQAYSYCERYGSKLVEPSGFLMTSEIGQLVTDIDSSVQAIWTGYNRGSYSSSFDDTKAFWSDGSEATVDVGVWDSQEPNLETGGCAMMEYDGARWVWKMTSCWQPMAFVCEATPCPSDTFRCDTGRCISPSLECNGVNNCGDDSDERNCPVLCNNYVTDTRQELSFPSSGQYQNSQTCQWVMEGPLGSRVHIDILELNTESGVDYLEVWGGGLTLSSSVLLHRFSGSLQDVKERTPLILSPNNMAMLRFVSDGSLTSSGFRFKWNSEFTCDLYESHTMSPVDGDGNPQTSTSSSESFCYSSCLQDLNCVAFTYNGQTTACTKMSRMPRTKGTPEDCCSFFVKSCPGNVGKEVLPNIPVLTSDLYSSPIPQYLYSPLYPIYSPGGGAFHWTIHAPGRNLVTLQILDVDIGVEDVVYIQDGASLSSSNLLTLHKSSSAATTHQVTSTGSDVTVYFSSETFSKTRGFLMSYETGCDSSIMADSGTIQSPGFDAATSYPNVALCSWTMTSSPGRPLRLTFSQFDLETGKDFVEIYKDQSNTQMHTGSGYTGFNTPSAVDSSDGTIRVVMRTSATVNRRGFKASFDAGCLPLTDSTISVSPPGAVFEGDVIEVTCTNQYIFAGSYTGESLVRLTCGSGGQWTTSDIPTCTKVLCGKVPQISNGFLSQVTGVFSGDTASYVCNTGYEFFPQNSPITCTNTGIWDPYPFCVSTVQCDPLLAPINGNLNVIIGNGRDTGSVVQFTCFNNYQIVGTAVIICNSGTWSASTPTCELSKCGLPFINNAILTPSTTVYQGDVITVTCKPGYQLLGSNTFQCGDSNSPPSCQNIDECTTGSSGCEQLCEDKVGSYECSCRDGYRLDSNGRSCDDINECNTDNGNCDQSCQNTVGSYSCSCPSGNTRLFESNGQYGINIPVGEDGTEPWNVYHLGHSCVVPPSTTCPALSSRTIPFGYALTDQDVFGVGDTVRFSCQIGYVINGPSSIICQNTGQWTSNPPTCVLATCPYPVVTAVDVTPGTEISYRQEYTGTCDVIGVGQVTLTSTCVYNELDASFQASIQDLQCPTAVSCGTPTRLAGTEPYQVITTTYGSTFTFDCRRPYFTLEGASNLNGNQVVTCMGDGRWDFGDLRCIDPSCKDPGTEPGVIQVATSYEEYSLVYYRCVRTGFEPEDKRPLQCVWDDQSKILRWNGTAPECVDVEPPTFTNCEQKQLTIRKYTAPKIVDPSAADNVKVESFTITPEKHAMRQVLFQNTQVTYTARDAANNVQTCDIVITMQDEESPQIKCIAPYTITLQSPSETQDINMNALVSSTSDNSNAVIVTYSPASLRVDRSSIGETYTVRATATDPSGNTDSCLVQMKVEAPKCTDWSIYVENGQTSCTPTSNGYRCSVSCDTGHIFYESSSLSSIDMTCSIGGDWSRDKPTCVGVREINYRQMFRLEYLLGNTADPSCEEDYLDQLTDQRSQFIDALNDLCSTTTPSTTVSMPTDTPILTLISDTAYAIFTMDIKASSGFGSQGAVEQCAGLIRNAFVGITGTLSSIQRLQSSSSCTGSAIANFDRSMQDGSDCSSNEERETVNGAESCVSCPTGYYSLNNQGCLACPGGTYFNGDQGACAACPSDARWTGEAAKSEMDCYRSCAFGYTSTTGQALCSICPENTFSLDRFTCQPCPPNTFTSDDGQWLESRCESRCPVGQFSATGLVPCSPCPLGFYQTQEGATSCTPCREDYTTSTAGSTSPGQCIEGDPVLCDSFKCLNGGTCSVVGHEYFCTCREGYTGQNCAIYINPCASQPCYNNAICIPTGTTSYQCNCNSQLLTGDRCEVNTNSICDNNPCQNYGGCRTGVSNYFCLCPSYSMYTFGSTGVGSECTRLREPCTSFPCENGADCEAFGFIRRRCICKSGYTGDACETSIDGCQANPCKNNADCLNGPGGSVNCVCPEGYSGDFCDERVDRCQVDTCPAFSTCIDNYQTGQLLCYCQDGFVKDGSGSCVQVVTDVCNPNPCFNDGICYSVNNTFGCYCKNGYEGSKCQSNKDDCEPNPCQNGGICSDTNPPPASGTGFTCQCPSDTYGDTCLDAVNVCQLGTNPCNPGYSKCIDLYRGYFCECFTGYYGVDCTERDNLLCDSYPCQHGGVCTEIGNTFSCDCPSGYQGQQCESLVDYCVNDPCSPGGVCVSHSSGYRCSCSYGYRGDNCQTQYDLCQIANPCQAAGSTCTDLRGFVVCSCPAGYSGPYCQTKDVECSPTSCANGATCFETQSGISCSCAPGFEGSRCETNTDECLSSNCPAGSKCVDGVNSFTCVCEDNRIGADCSKEVSSDFDIVLSGQSSHRPQDYQALVEPINQRAFTVSAWVRHTAKTEPGTALSLYGLSSETDFSDPSKILSIDKDGVALEFSGSRRVPFNSPVDDGFWHHVVVAWDSNQGSVRVYVDGAQTSSATSYGTQSSVRPFGWLILGGHFDSTTSSVDRSGGMIGRLSRVHISENALSQSQVTTLTSNKAAVPDGLVGGYRAAIATGTSAAVDYNSELTAGTCMSASNCESLDSLSSGPSFVSCPDDQVVVSSRSSKPAWSVPTSSGAAGTVVKTTKLSGATEMGWGTTSVVYAQTDSNGNADICSFKIHNRRTSCERPIDNQGQIQSCTEIGGVLRCSVRCSGSQKLSTASPKYFSCGSNGMFDQASRVLPFEYSSCSACTTPEHDTTFTMDYRLNGNPACGSFGQIQAQTTLTSDIKSTLTSLAAAWSNLCGSAASCNDVSVVTQCNNNVGVTVTVTVTGLTQTITRVDRSSSAPFDDIISIAAVDDQLFTYVGKAEPDFQSFVVMSVPACPTGSVLIGDCCSECGYGYYYSSASSECVACPKGTYLDVLGSSGVSSASPCKACPPGTTTDNVGSGDRSDCLASCTQGSFYNSAVGQCELCPVGFYADQAGSFFCQGCPFEESTSGTNSTARTACSLNPVTTTTTSAPPITPEPVNVGASTNEDEDSLTTTLLIVLAIILFIIVLLIIILFCCFREWMERLCPCMTAKITPESKSQWHYVDRFGETNLKFVSYKMGEVRRSDRESLVSEDNHSVHTNISLQVPIFEEQLNGSVVKRSVHVAGNKENENVVASHVAEEEEAPKKKHKRKRSKSRRRRKQMEQQQFETEDETRIQTLPPLHKNAKNNAPPMATASSDTPGIKRPPSAFNRPKPNLEQVPYQDFIPSPRHANAHPDTSPRGRINLDSDDDLR